LVKNHQADYKLTFWKSLRRVPGRVAGTCFQSRLEAQKKTIDGKGDIGNVWKSDVPQTKRSWMLMNLGFALIPSHIFTYFYKPLLFWGLLLFQQKKV